MQASPKAGAPAPPGPSWAASPDKGGPSEQAGDWPSSLREWVERAFAQCHTDLERSVVEGGLKATISEAGKNKEVWVRNWDTWPLPAKKRDMWIPPPERSNSFQKDSYHKELSPSPRKKQKKGKDGFKLANRAFDSQEEKKRLSRANRFVSSGCSLAERARVNSHDRWAPIEHDGGADEELDFTVQGCSTVVEKKYLRLTAAPDPHTVRPEPILRRAVELIRAKIGAFEKANGDESDNEAEAHAEGLKLPADRQAMYIYLWEQLKSIRQDLTVQRIRNEFTVEVYEMHARICLEYCDDHELKQCQAQLTQLYEEGLGTSEGQREFMAYNILYNVGQQADNNVNDLMLQLSAEDRRDVHIAHALKVRAAAALRNYCAFFQLFLEAPGHSQFLLSTFADRQRFEALRRLCRAYQPTLGVEFIAKNLAFDEQEECALWMEDHGAVLTADRGLLDSKASRPLLVEHSIAQKLEEERKNAERKAEIVPISFS